MIVINTDKKISFFIIFLFILFTKTQKTDAF